MTKQAKAAYDQIQTIIRALKVFDQKDVVERITETFNHPAKASESEGD